MFDLLAQVALWWFNVGIVGAGLWAIVVGSIKAAGRRKAADDARLLRGEVR